jgi:hypothetical protein
VAISESVVLAEPVFLRNLLIYPLQGSMDNGTEVASLERILEKEEGEFRELDTPDINQIIFNNQSEYPVLMLDGEEIVGSMQNRIVTDSILIPARSTSDLPVVCAEQGRWNDIGSFQTGHYSYPGIRAILSLRGKKENGLQKKIWKEIERKLIVTRTLSTTSSMHDIYNNLDDEVTRYVEDFESLNDDTIGFIGAAGGKILGCDMFLNQATYREFEKKLIQSYALDAIEHRQSTRAAVDTVIFLEDIKRSFKKKKIANKTQHFSLREDKYSGQGLVHEGRLIHLSVFPR